MIKLIKPYIAFDEVKDEFEEIFQSGWFTKGKYVEQFREELKKYIGCKYSFLTTSATTALSLSLEIVGVKAGDEVIVSDFSFPATANVLENIGAIPVFADVDLDTFNMSVEDLEQKITEKTKAVIFVDALGNPTNIHIVRRICKKYSIPLIEDAACAIGSSEFGYKCGNIADITCFSFHPRKLLTTGEGGAITTNNEEFAKKLEVKLNHGAIVKNGKLDFVESGYNYRMSELQAVMGIKQLLKLDNIIEGRKLIRDEYIKYLEPLGFEAQKIGRNVVYNIQSLVFKVPGSLDRDSLIQYLKKKGIESTIGTYCLSNTTYYKNKYNNIQEQAKYLEENTITLPCYDGIDVKFVVEAIK